MEIYDYIVLNNENVLDLQKDVMEKLKEGYIPCGFQVVITPGARYFTFFQALYKDDFDWDELDQVDGDIDGELPDK